MASRKQQQYAIMGAAALGVGALSYITFGILGPAQPTANPFANEESSVDVSIVADRTSAAAPEFSWVASSKIEIERMNQLVESLREELEQQRQSNEAAVAQVRAEYDEALVQQAQKIADLEGRGPGPAGAQEVYASSDAASFTPDYSDTGSEFIRRSGGAARIREVPTPPGPLGDGRTITHVPVEGTATLQERAFGQSFTLVSLDDQSEGLTRNALRNYIPAGSYAPAVVLSGADAATNVTERENPVPVLFRITGSAVTAGRGARGARINIRGCTVQGSAIGDLSAERVKVRLISLTCMGRDGAVLETEITGYMAGKGKAGVRGPVVSREGGLVTTAAIAGALEGLATAAGKSGERKDQNAADIARNALQASAAGGVEQAASTLSEYYINRAEQYQPVISLHAGTEVELVFMEGVSLE